MYKVVQFFTDLEDDNYAYGAGDTFPRAGAKPSKERIAELASAENKRGIVLIKEVKEEKKTNKKEK